MGARTRVHMLILVSNVVYVAIYSDEMCEFEQTDITVNIYLVEDYMQNLIIWR